MTELDLTYLGILNPTSVWRNLSTPSLVERALARGEGALSDAGALVVQTGKYTGRSPDDRYVIDGPTIHDEIDWGPVNRPMSQADYQAIRRRVTAYLQGRELFVSDGYAGADPKYRQKIRVVNDLASQNLFIRQLLLRPQSPAELADFRPDFTIIAAPGFACAPEIDGTHSEAAILVNFPEKEIIIAGTRYAGEIKKSVFAIMNYLLPAQGVFPMHCSANIGQDGDVALFFGLSGTGKTTLSADPQRLLIGDDEHGWHSGGVFNIEGGCYAKCISLSREHEPDIYAAIRFGALVENVIMDGSSRKLDFNDDSLTENTRAGYPVEYIANAVIPGVGGQPKTVVFLTADAFGVLPPVAKLSREQAMYHFVSGYTARLAGTERGVTEPQATFSTCFGAPFLPRPARIYADLLGQKLDETGAGVYLINTGWAGGGYGAGKRISLPYTRAIVAAALNGDLEKIPTVTEPFFGLSVPTACPGAPAGILLPRDAWADKAEYDKTAKSLAERFRQNFARFDMPQAVIQAGPPA
ncbi:MAG: phosphoenolpyruvate carboxykinase (ATP) [Peptococcaceae bacterium]|jgi:phosphoenolpyruvate carboxykinase (ATP)|nr:phosphoenolpyruvate carboxykinase (ATP) [Peptococcaceae bacterium]